LPLAAIAIRLSGYDMESCLSRGIYSNVAMSPSPKTLARAVTTSPLEPHERGPFKGNANICESMQFILGEGDF